MANIPELAFNPAGNAVGAFFWGALPLFILLVDGIGRLLHGRRGFTMRTPWLLLLLVAYYGTIYSAFFFDQFYWMDRDDGRWEVIYRLPARTEAIPVAAIREIGLDHVGLSARTARLIITTREGDRYRSAQVSNRRARELLEDLRAAANLAPRGQPGGGDG